MATPIPADKTLKACGLPKLQEHAQAHGVRWEGMSKSQLVRLLAARRDAKPAPQETGTGKTPGSEGVEKCYVRQQTVYALATALQCVRFAFTLVQSDAERQALLDVVAGADDAAAERIKAAGEARPEGEAAAKEQASKAAEKVAAEKAAAKAEAERAAAEKSTVAAPATYKELIALGKDNVLALAVAKGVKDAAKLAWAELCSQLWAKIKPADAASTSKGTSAGKHSKAKPAASKGDAANKPAAPAAVDPIVPGCFSQDGKPLTLSQVMAALAKLPPAKKSA